MALPYLVYGDPATLRHLGVPADRLDGLAERLVPYGETYREGQGRPSLDDPPQWVYYPHLAGGADIREVVPAQAGRELWLYGAYGQVEGAGQYLLFSSADASPHTFGSDLTRPERLELGVSTVDPVLFQIFPPVPIKFLPGHGIFGQRSGTTPRAFLHLLWAAR